MATKVTLPAPRADALLSRSRWRLMAAPRSAIPVEWAFSGPYTILSGWAGGDDLRCARRSRPTTRGLRGAPVGQARRAPLPRPWPSGSSSCAFLVEHYTATPRPSGVRPAPARDLSSASMTCRLRQAEGPDLSGAGSQAVRSIPRVGASPRAPMRGGLISLGRRHLTRTRSQVVLQRTAEARRKGQIAVKRIASTAWRMAVKPHSVNPPSFATNQFGPSGWIRCRGLCRAA